MDVTKKHYTHFCHDTQKAKQPLDDEKLLVDKSTKQKENHNILGRNDIANTEAK